MIKPDHFLIDDLVVEIVRSSRRKTLSIEVGIHGVKARAPMRMRHSVIVEFVVLKQEWIKRHRARLPDVKPELILNAGSTLLLNGNHVTLAVTHGSSKPVYLTPCSIVVPVKQSHLPLETSVRNKLIRWYKSAAYDELQRKVAYYSNKMSTPSNKSLNIKVRDYKRRWGSCDSKGALSFNWRIIQAPIEIFDYVVVHELAHCHEFNHSKRFWAIVEQQMPDWKGRQQWLQTHGSELYRL